MKEEMSKEVQKSLGLTDEEYNRRMRNAEIKMTIKEVILCVILAVSAWLLLR